MIAPEMPMNKEVHRGGVQPELLAPTSESMQDRSMVDPQHRFATPRAAQTATFAIGAIGLLVSMNGDPVGLAIGLILAIGACSIIVGMHWAEVSNAVLKRVWHPHLTLPVILLVATVLVGGYSTWRLRKAIAPPPQTLQAAPRAANDAEIAALVVSRLKQSMKPQSGAAAAQPAPFLSAPMPTRDRLQIYVACEIPPPPLVIPPTGHAYFVPVWEAWAATATPSGVATFTGEPGSPIGFGTTEEVRKCVVQNSGGAPVFNLTVALDIQFLEAVSAPVGSLGIRAGRVKRTLKWGIPIDRLSGPNGKYEFYVRNETRDVLVIDVDHNVSMTGPHGTNAVKSTLMNANDVRMFFSPAN